MKESEGYLRRMQIPEYDISEKKWLIVDEEVFWGAQGCYSCG
jgi:hypothetical protein